MSYWYSIPSIWVRERIPLKQGLKLGAVQIFTISAIVRERIPLKQGLKLDKFAGWEDGPRSQREDSIKTRIETDRILDRKPRSPHVRERIPLKQGLKQTQYIHKFLRSRVRERIPLKQGLKLQIHTLRNFPERGQREDSIKTRIETKLSLYFPLLIPFRQREDSIKTRIETFRHPLRPLQTLVRERIPLKQGLKQLDNRKSEASLMRQREDSIKTRIETVSSLWKYLSLRSQREDSIKTRIETSLKRRKHKKLDSSERGFH